ncbi:MAG: AAA family ATPase [Deltaproteobacteria bacterium]|nr:AAA family ATPase [Deltaproteobacteria bacterium]NNK42953.1 AAA domain-containing protein [Myxococcales bacterium]
MQTPIDDSLSGAREVAERLGDRLRAAVRGRDEVVELVLVALLSDGHVLLEDYPGSGKTTLARALGNALEEEHGTPGIAAFRRIQFTPDLLPSDITGTNIFDVETSRFAFRRGPVFAHIVLADEINRTSPKVQAAMLEAMAEKQVTVDNQSYLLDDLFFVIATQNPLDLAGTYPLPTPQLDRFLFKIEMKHIDRASELEVLEQYPRASLEVARDHPGVTRSEILAARRQTRVAVHVAPVVKEALVDLARLLRSDSRVLQGASTRALVLMLPALQARAVIHGRDFVSPEDIAALAPYVFKHRLECAPGVEDVNKLIEEATGVEVEKLARASLRRG